MQRSLDRFSPKTRPVGYINHQQLTTIIFHMINQQVSPENRYRKNKKLCRNFTGNHWNFFGASKLAGNTQNRPAVPKNRRKTLKTEQKQSLEARRSLIGVSPELAGTCQRRQNRPATSKQQQQTQTLNTDQHFNNPNINQPDFFFFSLDGCCNFAGHHRQDKKPPQNMLASITDHQKQTKYIYIYIYFHRKVFRSP
jgi:hypothetical protein